ncbi:MAG: DNA mismatch endonuclease Vsr [Boseongicola sp. SB0670_bin_30]|nr:DNA mismatch endonuclease Vsr [Boseongicola sp. SB0670_bin_30]
MTDTVDRQTRSRIMTSVRRFDTKPEMVVRQSLHRIGFRFRTSDRSLPGSPDHKLSRYGAVVFVNGCFWHHHRGCRYATTPASNRAWWADKFARNVARDADKIRRLREAGWRVVVVWECAVRNEGPERDRAINQLADWIRSGNGSAEIPLAS